MAGTKPGKKYNEKKIRKSIKGLKEFYTGVLALALFEAIRGVAEVPREHFFPQFWFFLFAFCATLLPFYHGNMRYFDDNYLDTTPDSAWLFMLDYLLLSIVAGLLVWMGAIFGNEFNNGDYFIKIYAILLLMDIVWGFVAKFHSDSWDEVKHWLWLNVCTLAAVVLLWGLCQLCPLLHEHRIGVFLLITLARSVLDYGLNWDLYFPEEKGPVAPNPEPGAAGATT